MRGVRSRQSRHRASSAMSAVGRSAAARAAADPRAYTPRHLVERILTGRAALEGERKQVTVLFADIQDSMQLAERLGAEAWHRLLDRFFHLLNRGRAPLRGDRQPVHRRRRHGPVRRAARARGPRPARLSRGAGICATGCAASAPSSARRAASTLRRAHGAQLGRGGGRTHRRRPAHGLHRAGAHRRPGAAGRAARGAQHRVRRAGDARRWWPTTSSCATSAPSPSRASASRCASTRSSARGRSSTRIDVVAGAQRCALRRSRAELGVLEQALDEAMAGHGQVDRRGRRSRRRQDAPLPRAGCGSVAARGAAIGPGALSVARRAASRFLPILELLRSLFGIDADEPADASRRKIRRSLLAAQPRLRRRAAASSSTSCRSPTPSSPCCCLEEQRARGWPTFLRRLVQAQSAVGPLVLFIDDLHWIDADGDALLGEIVDALGWTPPCCWSTSVPATARTG